MGTGDFNISKSNTDILREHYPRRLRKIQNSHPAITKRVYKDPGICITAAHAILVQIVDTLFVLFGAKHVIIILAKIKLKYRYNIT